METITFECELITPMFMYGADGKKPELRPPSIKGAMRFWWRAMNGHLPIDELREKEAAIFGGSEGDGKKSSFSIRIQNEKITPVLKSWPRSHKTDGINTHRQIDILDYLCFGPMQYDKNSKSNQFSRNSINCGSTFHLLISVKNEKLKEEILQTLSLLNCFGSLGSKSRNGFGSFKYQNTDLTKKLIQSLIKTSEVKAFSSFNGNVKLFKTKQDFDSWDDALAEIGIAYRTSKLNLENKHNYDKRQYIGSPIKKSLLDRHSKPYFLKVNKNLNGRYEGYILFLPSKYCEGLDIDKQKNNIDHKKQNENFAEVCNEFNTKLAETLEVIL